MYTFIIIIIIIVAKHTVNLNKHSNNWKYFFYILKIPLKEIGRQMFLFVCCCCFLVLKTRVRSFALNFYVHIY